MVKGNKKFIIIIGMLIFIFLMTEKAFAKEKVTVAGIETIEDSSGIIEAITIRQKALKDGDYEKAWKQWTKLSQRYHTLENYKRRMKIFPEFPKSIYNAQLGEPQPITQKRAWVPATSSSLSLLDGFYIVKEDGKWKPAAFRYYIKAVREDLTDLVRAIHAYYKDNKNLPQSLAQLTSPIKYIETIPQDPFSDENNPYIYKFTDERFMLYSLGPDSDDDSGSMTYSPANGIISNGDIGLKGKGSRKR